MPNTKKYSTEVIVDFDNEFHLLDPSSQTLLDLLATYIACNSPIGYGDSGVMCNLEAVFLEDPDFRDLIKYSAGLDYTGMVGHLRLLDHLKYIQLEKSEDMLDCMLTCKGWMASKEWKDTNLIDIAANETGDNWDWDSILPLAPPHLARQIIEQLEIYRGVGSDL